MNEFEFLNSIHPVSRETFVRLSTVVDSLKKWQEKTNLIAPSTLDDIWRRHVADSLQCVSIKPDAMHWLDLGSGGGFPGLVISSVLAEDGDKSVVLVESNNKKTAFLRRAARQSGARATVLTSRIEDVQSLENTPDVVTARALAELPQLLELAAPWLEKGATGLFHKGREYREELANCDGLWSFDLLCHQSKVASDSVILEITNFVPAKK